MSMMSNECANCLLHDWKQVQDQTKLQRCKKCKLIHYCGKDCQTEHWHRVHKKQCKYFADPAKAQKWHHKEDDCAICLQAAQVGKVQLMRADNPNYVCIYREFLFPPFYHHPHPFPFNGQRGNTLEKAAIVLWQLIRKFQLTQPRRVILNCEEELNSVYAALMSKRISIWRNRKIFPNTAMRELDHSLDSISVKINKIVSCGSTSNSDPFQLRKIIDLVNGMLFGLDNLLPMQSMKDLLAGMPTEYYSLVSKGLDSSGKYLALAIQVIQALAIQIIPFQDVLKIICGGNLKQSCSFCFEEMIVTDVMMSGSLRSSDQYERVVVFDILFMDMYRCDKKNCHDKCFATFIKDRPPFNSAVLSAHAERWSNRCDFCSLLPPTKDLHRCIDCLTTMYCSKACQEEDWQIHQMVCKEDVDERKKKYGASIRRKEASDTLNKLANSCGTTQIKDFMDVAHIDKEVLSGVEKVWKTVRMEEEFGKAVGKFKSKGNKKKADK